jgi:flagellar assembly factor FliW
MGNGEKDSNPFNAFAYSFSLDNSKTVRSVSLTSNRNVVVLAMTLVPEGK